MLHSTFLLKEKFELSGTWWLPGGEEHRLRGTLKYSPTEIELTVAGGFPLLQNEPSNPPSRFFRSPVIYGQSEDGTDLSLLDTYETGHQFLRSGELTSTYSGIYVVIGNHTPALAQLKLSHLDLGSTLLDTFENNITFNVDDRSEQRIDVSVKYVAPERLVIRSDATAASYMFASTFSWGGESRNKFYLRANNVFSISPDEPQLFDWHFTRMWRVCHLFTLLMDEPFKPAWIQYSIDHNFPGWIVYRSVKWHEEGDKPYFLLFYRAHVEQLLPGIVDTWLTANDVFWDAVYLFIDARQTRGDSLEPRFLTATQAIEAYSRATTSSLYMEADKYNDIYAVIVDAIPQELGGDHRSSLKNRIKYGNEFSFRKRLSLLIDSLSPEAVKCVCKSPNEFVAGIVDTRNYLVHYTDELRPKALSAVDLSWACEKVIMLLRILLLRHIGIEESAIVARIRDHHRLSQYIGLWQGFKESKV